MKKKLDVSIKCNDLETFNKYFSPEYNKIVGNLNTFQIISIFLNYYLIEFQTSIIFYSITSY